MALAGLTAPATSALLPLFAWRAWRARTRHALAQAGVLAACALVQVVVRVVGDARRPAASIARTGGLDVGVFAATVWMRTLIVPLLGMDRAQAFGALMLRSGGIGTPIGVGLLVLAGLLVAWLARGLRPGDRGMLAGAYVLVTSVTFLTAVGDKAMLLHTPWTSSRYAFTPGVLVLAHAARLRPARRRRAPGRAVRGAARMRDGPWRDAVSRRACAGSRRGRCGATRCARGR